MAKGVLGEERQLHVPRCTIDCCMAILQLTQCQCASSPGAGTGGLVAKDALGNDVKASEWLATHKKGDRSLTQGLKVGVLRNCGLDLLAACLPLDAQMRHQALQQDGGLLQSAAVYPVTDSCCPCERPTAQSLLS